ncbi:MAG TPA: hypothetical protein VHF65_00280 [Nitrososphaera sp.]|nr:hypothetical protein [Nitrososphaera sp.]
MDSDCSRDSSKSRASLIFSIPLFFSPGCGIGATTNIQEEEQQPPTVRGTKKRHLNNDALTQ